MLMSILTLACVVTGSTHSLHSDRLSVQPAPVIIHQVHERPLDVVLAWHAPPDGGEALTPPLHAAADYWTGEAIKRPGSITAGDRIVRGTLANDGQTDIFILSGEGQVIVLPPREHLWVGPAAQLLPTHRCVCTCRCGPDRITTPCANGNCMIDGTDCIDFSGRYWKLKHCRRVYVPLPLESPAVS